MTQVFYEVLPGTEAYEFCHDYHRLFMAKRAEYVAYAESKGADGWVGGSIFGLTGLMFRHGVEIPDGLRKSRRKTSSGDVFYIPGVRTAAGKALKAEFEALGQPPSSDTFCDRFGIPRGLRYRKSGQEYGSIHLTSGGFSTAQIIWPQAGRYWVVLPDIDAEIAQYRERGCTVKPDGWTLPDGLKKSSRARWELALAAAKVAEEEAA